MAERKDYASSNQQRMAPQMRRPVALAGLVFYGACTVACVPIVRKDRPASQGTPQREADGRVLPGPQTLSDYVNHPDGTRLSFRVVGGVVGTVWGTSLYTLDSHLSTAAVHAGVVGPGEEGIVVVILAAGQPSYTGSTQRGVTTQGFGAYHKSYRFERATEPTASQPTASQPSPVGDGASTGAGEPPWVGVFKNSNTVVAIHVVEDRDRGESGSAPARGQTQLQGILVQGRAEAKFSGVLVEDELRGTLSGWTMQSAPGTQSAPDTPRSFTGRLENEDEALSITFDDGSAAVLRRRGPRTSTEVRALIASSKEDGQKSMNEASTLGSLRSIQTGETMYLRADREGDSDRGYGTLSQLGAEGLIQPDLATGQKAGYVFSLSTGRRDGDARFAAVAGPAVFGTTGDRYYGTDQSGVVFYSKTAPFGAQDGVLAKPEDALPMPSARPSDQPR